MRRALAAWDGAADNSLSRMTLTNAESQTFDISVSALTLQYLSEYDFDAVFHKHPFFQVKQQVIQFGRPSSL